MIALPTRPTDNAEPSRRLGNRRRDVGVNCSADRMISLNRYLGYLGHLGYLRRTLPRLWAAGLVATTLCGGDVALAQLPGVASGASVAIPGFWDPRRRPERPDMSRITLIRFVTEIDYPPFNY